MAGLEATFTPVFKIPAPPVPPVFTKPSRMVRSEMVTVPAGELMPNTRTALFPETVAPAPTMFSDSVRSIVGSSGVTHMISESGCGTTTV